MKLSKRDAAHAFFLLLLGMWVSAYGATSTRSSLGLFGGTFFSITTDSNGFLLGTVDGPTGVYYSVDQGSSWSSAMGGSFASGAGNQVIATGTRAFLTGDTDKKLYYATLPAAGASSWSASWTQSSTIQNVGALSSTSLVQSGSSGAYVLAGSVGDPLGAVVHFIDASSLTYNSSTVDNTAGASVSQITLAKSGGNIYVYVLTEAAGSKKLWQGQFVSGSVSSWSEITSNVYSARSSVNIDDITRILGTSSGSIYVQITDGNPTATYFNTVVSTVPASVPPTASSFTRNSSIQYQVRSGCASVDSTYINLGFNLSTDGGATWTGIPPSGSTGTGVVPGATGGTIRLEEDNRGGLCLFYGNSSPSLYKRTTRGLAVTNNVTNVSPTWTELYQGVEAVTVYSVGQNLSYKQRMCLGSNAGISVTDNLTSGSPPSWSFICPNNDCVGGKTVLMNPSDNSQCIVGSGAIYSIAISGSGTSLSLTGSAIGSQPTLGVSAVGYAGLIWSSALPNTAVAGFYDIDGTTAGGIYLYNASNPTSWVLDSSPKLTGAISALTNLNGSVFYASTKSPSTPAVYVSNNSASTFTAVSDSTLTGMTVRKFAYDSTNDVLYLAGKASGSPKAVKLTKALAGGGSWQTLSSSFPSSYSSLTQLTVLAVDTSNGTVYAGSDQQVWQSTDGGSNWSLSFNTNSDERVYVLFYDALLSGTNMGLQSVISAINQVPSLSGWLKILLALMVIGIAWHFHNNRQNSY